MKNVEIQWQATADGGKKTTMKPTLILKYKLYVLVVLSVFLRHK